MRAHASLVQRLLWGVVNLAYTRFKAGKDGVGGRAVENAEKQVQATPLWDMLYADNAGVVSQSSEQPRKMTIVIVIVSAAFSLIASEAKT